MLDGEVWLEIDEIGFPIRGRRIQHFTMSRSYEPEVVKTLKSILSERAVESFWDIGANIGFYSWLLKSLSPSTSVEAFEADPRNAELFRKTLLRNSNAGVSLMELAISDHTGDTNFVVDNISGFTGSVASSACYSLAATTYGGGKEMIVVKCASIDELRKTRSKISLIKIDVEGHEEAVVRGALNTFVRDRPHVIIECITETFDSVQRMLKEAGYVIRQIEGFNYLAIHPDWRIAASS